jgi:hypothetical protein
MRTRPQAALPGFSLTQSLAFRIPAVADAETFVARKPVPAIFVAVVA